MQFRALLYVKNEIVREQALLEWMDTEAPAFGVQCVEICGDVNAGQIHRAAETCGVNLADSLFIVTNETEWNLAGKLGLAALPYAPAGNNAPRFEGAWMVVEGFAEADYDFLNKCYQRAHNLPWDILETERCRVREFSMEDMDALFALYAQPGVTDYMEGLYERDEEERYEQAYIENMYRYYGYGMWLVEKKGTGEIIGRAGLEHRDYNGDTELEMGYLIAPREQRKGYATEVCRALVEYARTYLDFPRINCLIQKDNDVSKRLAGRLGFSFFEKMDVNGQKMERYILSFL
jgi:RimJ/RimL family protein N-acetyltransferase